MRSSCACRPACTRPRPAWPRSSAAGASSAYRSCSRRSWPASGLWTDALDLPALAAPHRDEIDAVELRLPTGLHPSPACLAAVERCRRELGLPVVLSPIVARERAAGKQLPRARLAYHLAEAR